MSNTKFALLALLIASLAATYAYYIIPDPLVAKGGKVLLPDPFITMNER